MGRTVIGHLQECVDPSSLIAYDVDRQSLETTQKQYPIRCTESLDSILEDRQVGLVFVTASNGAHKELSIAAMRAGKAVMCEKPMANTLQDAIEMVEEAEKNGVYFQIGFELRYSKLFTTVKKWIDAGKLGEVRNIQCTYICSEYWGKKAWRTKRAYGGSMFGEKLCHYIDLPRWWTGSDLTEIYAMASPNVVPYYEVLDNYHASFKFSSGAVTHLTFMMPFASTAETDPLRNVLDQQKDDGHELRYLVMGTRGGAETDVFHRRIKRWEYRETENGFHCDLVETLTWPAEEDHVHFHNTKDQSHDIVRRVHDGLPPYISARDSLETMKACAAVDLSIDLNRAVQVGETMGLPVPDSR